jgi:uncharacterized protein with GYD domain
MTQNAKFTEFVALIEMTDSSAQNVQELASVWGEVQTELDEIDASIQEAYAVLGEFDFLVTFEGPATETAFETEVVLERHGLRVQTLPMIETTAFSELVEDM